MGIFDSFLSNEGQWIIEYQGQYWNGFKFEKRKVAAKGFRSSSAAWAYVDRKFSEQKASTCNLYRVRK